MFKDKSEVIRHLKKEILKMEKALAYHHALEDVNYLQGTEDDYWVLLENKKLHRDASYLIFLMIEE